jgi:hypothetical protein
MSAVPAEAEVPGAIAGGRLMKRSGHVSGTHPLDGATINGSSKHEEHEVEKIEVSGAATKPSRIIDMARRKRPGA